MLHTYQIKPECLSTYITSISVRCLGLQRNCSVLVDTSKPCKSAQPRSSAQLAAALAARLPDWSAPRAWGSARRAPGRGSCGATQLFSQCSSTARSKTRSNASIPRYRRITFPNWFHPKIEYNTYESCLNPPIYHSFFIDSFFAAKWIHAHSSNTPFSVRPYPQMFLNDFWIEGRAQRGYFSNKQSIYFSKFLSKYQGARDFTIWKLPFLSRSPPTFPSGYQGAQYVYSLKIYLFIKIAPVNLVWKISGRSLFHT